MLRIYEQSCGWKWVVIYIPWFWFFPFFCNVYARFFAFGRSSYHHHEIYKPLEFVLSLKVWQHKLPLFLCAATCHWTVWSTNKSTVWIKLLRPFRPSLASSPLRSRRHGHPYFPLLISFIIFYHHSHKKFNRTRMTDNHNLNVKNMTTFYERVDVIGCWEIFLSRSFWSVENFPLLL